jgi:hypothetical protein
MVLALSDQCLGVRVHFEVQGSLQGFGFRVSRFRISGFPVSKVSVSMVSGFKFSGFRVSGLRVSGFRVSGLKGFGSQTLEGFRVHYTGTSLIRKLPAPRNTTGP